MAKRQSNTPNATGGPVRGPLPGPGGGGPRVMMGQVQKAKDTQGTMRRLWGYLRQKKWGLLGVMALVTITTGFGLFGPFLMGKAIDDYMLAGDLPGLTRIVLLMVGVYVITALTTWLQIYVMTGVAQRTVRDIRNDLFAKLQTLSLRFFDQHPHGELMSRLTNDVENISNVLGEGAIQFIASILTIIGVVVMMLAINVPLAIVSMVTIPLMMFLTKWISTRTRKGFRRQQQVLGALNGVIEETITGARVVKAYSQEQALIIFFQHEAL